MKKYLHLILFLPCVLLLSLQSNGSVAESNIWDIEQSIEENHGNLDNHDFDWVVYKYNSPVVSRLPEEPVFVVNTSIDSTTFSDISIRAPPLSLI